MNQCFSKYGVCGNFYKIEVSLIGTLGEKRVTNDHTHGGAWSQGVVNIVLVYMC